MSTQIAISEGRTQIAGPERFESHHLHIEPDGSFSILALVWRPGQATRIHDHLTWCVFGVIQGVEHEELFDPDGNRIGESANETGDVTGFAPPGDIHRVRNIGDSTAISIHIYGTDVTRVGSSARRYKIGDDLERAVAFNMALGPAAEVLRMWGERVDDIRPRIADDLRKALADYVVEGGAVVAPASTWAVTARAPALPGI